MRTPHQFRVAGPDASNAGVAEPGGAADSGQVVVIGDGLNRVSWKPTGALATVPPAQEQPGE